MCSASACVDGCCVSVPTGQCASDTLLAEEATADGLPPVRVHVALPQAASAANLKAPATLSSLAGDEATGLKTVDDTPLTARELVDSSGSHWAYPLYGQRYSTLHMGSNGIIQGSATPPCNGFWGNPGGQPLCWYTTRYTGLVAPISTDWAPNQWPEAVLSTRMAGSSICASWYNVGLYSSIPVNNVTLSTGAASFDACLSADGGAAWWLRPQVANGLSVPTAAQLAAGQPPLSGMALPPDHTFLQPQQWLAGLRSALTPQDAPLAADSRSSSGALADLLDEYFVTPGDGPSNSWLQPGQRNSTIAVQSQHQLLFSNAGLRRAQLLEQALGTCALGTVACIASRCSPSAGGASIVVHWAGVGCGMRPLLRSNGGPATSQAVSQDKLQALTSFKEGHANSTVDPTRAEPFNWAPWFDAGLQVLCAFGTVPSTLTAAQAMQTANFVNASVRIAGIAGVSHDVGATSFTCTSPALADVAGVAAAAALDAKAAAVQANPAAAHELAKQLAKDNSSSTIAASMAALASSAVPLSLLAVFPGSQGTCTDADAALMVLPVVGMHLNGNVRQQRVADALLVGSTAARRRFSQLGGRVLPLSVTYLGGDGNGTSCGCGAGSLAVTSQCTSIGTCQAFNVSTIPHGRLRRRVQGVQPAVAPVLQRPPLGQVDCAGDVFGTAESSACGACTGGSTDLPSSVDCAGVCGGSARVDACGVCAGGSTGLVPDANRDCAGVCGGTAAPDCLFVCSGGSTGRAPAVLDCAGRCGGSASVDSCDRCSGGNTNILPCTPPSGGGGGSGGNNDGGDDDGTGNGGGGGGGGGGVPTGGDTVKNSDSNPAVTDAILLAAVISFGSALAALALCYARMRWRQRRRTEFAVEAFDEYEARQRTEGLHDAALDALPTVTFTAELAEGPGGAICTVCQESFAKGSDVVQLPCKHLFHTDCIRQWLQRRTTCVVCQYELAGWAIEVAPIPEPSRAAPASAGAAGRTRRARGSHSAGAAGQRGGAQFAAQLPRQAVELPTVRRGAPLTPLPQAAQAGPVAAAAEATTDTPVVYGSNPVRRQSLACRPSV